MFLRFKSSRNVDGKRVFRIQIAEAFRCPITGRPKSRVLAHVGSLAEDRFNDPAWLWLFWQKLENTLVKLHISEGDKNSIRQSAKRRIPRSRFSERLKIDGSATSRCRTLG
jgi:hypothetical protein